MATKKDRAVPDRVLAMLEEMTPDGEKLLAHPRKFDRSDYEALNLVLAALGGKRVGRKVQAHVFPPGTDVRALVDNVLSSGRYEDPESSDFVQTPNALAEELVRMAEVKSGEEVLEPSAGLGWIAFAIRKYGGTAYCLDISRPHAVELRRAGFDAHECDFLTRTRNPDRPFDAVVMNPPFSCQQDIDHVRHAFDFLKSGGRLVAVMGAGTAFRTNKKAIEFREWLEERGGTIEELPEGTFKSEGTMVRAVVVRIVA